MSIVPDFADDVFNSYAHVNDPRIAEDDQGWVTDLHDVLSTKLLEEMRVRPRLRGRSRARPFHYELWLAPSFQAR